MSLTTISAHWTALSACLVFTSALLPCAPVGGPAGGGHEQSAWRTLHSILPRTAAANAEPREMSIPEFLLEVSIVVVTVVSLLTNLSVLLCFTQSADLRSHVPGLFIINLSFSNVLLAVVNMPATFLGVAERAKPFGDLFCQAVSFSETFLTTNAMLSMAALSMDRWIAVVFPLSYSSKMRYRDALLILAYSWLHSLTFSLTQMLMDWGGYSHTYASCTLHLNREERREQRAAYGIFTVLFHLSSFVLCLLVLCFAYLKVLRVARSHCKRIDVITVQTLLLLVDLHPRYSWYLRDSTAYDVHTAV